ncbi:CstA-like transporter-associated (seleno)protein [Micromonospora sp. CA-263727]|uniref:CstA-like transporter-associated (seleno)protein n=1 Tax=Micromonospora sp. CA-263727 TaxID=3239967 RepID=UPI003D8D0343
MTRSARDGRPRAQDYARSAWSALGRGCRHVIWYAREVVGENDYQHYLDHLRRHHPHTRPVSRRVFEQAKTERLETRPNSRCC